MKIKRISFFVRKVTKGEIRSRNSKKDRQRNGKGTKWQTTIFKTTRATRAPTKNRVWTQVLWMGYYINWSLCKLIEMAVGLHMYKAYYQTSVSLKW